MEGQWTRDCAAEQEMLRVLSFIKGTSVEREVDVSREKSQLVLNNNERMSSMPNNEYMHKGGLCIIRILRKCTVATAATEAGGA